MLSDMARKTREEQDDQSLIATTVENTVAPQITVGTTPVVIVGVNRKINIGNFEAIDVYSGITVPIDRVGDEEYMLQLEEKAREAVGAAFNIASKETFDRYKIIKEAQEGFIKAKLESND